MRDDDVVAVNAAHEIADHAVLIDRHFLGIEVLFPFGEPAFFRGGNLLLEGGERVGPARALLPAHLGDEGIEHQRGIADHGVVDAVFLVDIRGVVGRMDDCLTRRHSGAERGSGEARPDRQDEIGIGHEVRDHFRPRARGCAEREEMVFGDGALARIGSDDRRRNKLGQGCEAIARVGIEHALSRQQQRSLGPEQHAHRRLDRVGIGRRALHRHRCVIELARVLRLPHLGGNLDEHRAALPAAHGVIRPAHQVGQLLNRMRHGRPFGDGPINVGSAEHRPHVLPRQRQTCRDDEKGHVLGKGLRHAREGVLDARARLRSEDAVALAALDAGIAVRQADADALLPAQNRTDVERGAGLDQRVAGIAGEELRSLAPEDFGDDGGAIHGLVPPPLVHGSCAVAG